MTSPAELLISREEYDARTAAGERLEYDRGEVIEMANNDSQHDRLKVVLAADLNVQLRGIAVAGNEVAFEVAPDRVRHPDVAVFLSLPRGIAGQKFQGAPDLAIEIVSPSETALDLDARIRLYLENGAKAVWVVWPPHEDVNAGRIDIHQRNQPTRHYGPGDVIENEQPIPAFRLRVADLFD